MNSKELSYGSPYTGELSPYKFVAYTAAATQTLQEIRSSGTIAYFKGKAHADGNGISISEGEALVKAERNCEVKAGSKIVKLFAGSIAQINVSSDSVSVRNLHDTRTNGIIMHSGLQTISLNPGQQAVCATTTPVALQKIDSDGVGKRRLRTRETPGAVLVTCEFSPVSFLTTNHVLTTLRRSARISRHAAHTKLLSTVEKTVAAISMATASHGPYLNGGKLQTR